MSKEVAGARKGAGAICAKVRYVQGQFLEHDMCKEQAFLWDDQWLGFCALLSKAAHSIIWTFASLDNAQT